MDTTLIIAIIGCVAGVIGCVTGVVSILIQFYSYVLTKPRLKIEIDKTLHSYFFKSKDFNADDYICDFSAVISLVITNKSAYPVTISNVILKSKKLRYSIKVFNDFSYEVKSIRIDDSMCAIYRPSEQLSLPLRVDAFDTVFGSIGIPGFDSLVDSQDLSKPVFVKLRILTPRKTYCLKVRLYEYQYLHDHYQELRTK